MLRTNANSSASNRTNPNYFNANPTCQALSSKGKSRRSIAECPIRKQTWRPFKWNQDWAQPRTKQSNLLQIGLILGQNSCSSNEQPRHQHPPLFGEGTFRRLLCLSCQAPNHPALSRKPKEWNTKKHEMPRPSWHVCFFPPIQSCSVPNPTNDRLSSGFPSSKLAGWLCEPQGWQRRQPIDCLFCSTSMLVKGFVGLTLWHA